MVAKSPVIASVRSMDCLRHTALGLAAILTLTAAGTVGVMRLQGYGLREALFATVTTLSTVGLQIRPLSAGGQLLTIVLVVLGLGVVLYPVALATQ